MLILRKIFTYGCYSLWASSAQGRTAFKVSKNYRAGQFTERSEISFLGTIASCLGRNSRNILSKSGKNKGQKMSLRLVQLIYFCGSLDMKLDHIYFNSRNLKLYCPGLEVFLWEDSLQSSSFI